MCRRPDLCKYRDRNKVQGICPQVNRKIAFSFFPTMFSKCSPQDFGSCVTGFTSNDIEVSARPAHLYNFFLLCLCNGNKLDELGQDRIVKNGNVV